MLLSFNFYKVYNFTEIYGKMFSKWKSMIELSLYIILITQPIPYIANLSVPQLHLVACLTEHRSYRIY